MKRKSVNSRGWICVSGIKRGRQNVHELDAIGADQFFAGRDGVRPGVLCDGLAQGIHRTHSPAVHGFKQGVLVGDGEQFPDFGLVTATRRPWASGTRGMVNAPEFLAVIVPPFILCRRDPSSSGLEITDPEAFAEERNHLRAILENQPVAMRPGPCVGRELLIQCSRPLPSYQDAR